MVTAQASHWRDTICCDQQGWVKATDSVQCTVEQLHQFPVWTARRETINGGGRRQCDCV